MQQVASHSLYPSARPSTSLAHPFASPTWESAVVVVAMLVLGTKTVELLLAGDGSPNPVPVRMVYFFTYAVFGLLLVRSANQFLPIFLTAPLLLLVLLFPTFSILWSANPTETIERSLALAGTSMVGLYLGWRFTLGRTIFLLAVAMTIAVWLSLLAIALVPSVGIDQSGAWAGTWKGVHFHKNSLGYSAGLSCIFIAYAIADNRGAWKNIFCVSLAAALLLLFKSESTSAMLLTSTFLLFMLWSRLLQLFPLQIPVLMAIIVVSLIVAVVGLLDDVLIDQFLELLGKDRTLSSRVPLWAIVWSFIQERFWLGYGYEGFWHPGTLQLEIIRDRLYQTPFYSHNGLLETWLNGGVVLVILMISLILLMIVKATVLLVRWRVVTISSFPLVFCGHFIASNFTEAMVLAHNSLTWVLFVTVALFLRKWVRLKQS